MSEKKGGELGKLRELREVGELRDKRELIILGYKAWKSRPKFDLTHLSKILIVQSALL
ncbi:MAG: hypothetical protein F6J92_32985 [Symploca sp. SIO1A3]|nr:hypothetical protein [Symploca sp. SIO1A3]